MNIICINYTLFFQYCQMRQVHDASCILIFWIYIILTLRGVDMKKEDIYKSTFDYKVVGRNVKKYRKKVDMSQAKLAELTHMSVSHLSKIENGHYNSHFHNFVEIADVLNISIYELIGYQNIQSDYSFAQLIISKTNNYTAKQKELISGFIDLLIHLEE